MTGCSRELFADGYCGPHYKRKWRYGDPLAGHRPFLGESLRDRLDRQTVIRSDGCWEWAGTRDRFGYGKVYWQGRGYRAHRMAYRVARGYDVPELDHLCRNKSCVNPAHLEPVTHSENLRRHYAAITVCRHGHPYTDIYTDGAGKRRCRVCMRERQRQRRANR